LIVTTRRRPVGLIRLGFVRIKIAKLFCQFIMTRIYVKLARQIDLLIDWFLGAGIEISLKRTGASDEGCADDKA